jgi:hypothetical protein
MRIGTMFFGRVESLAGEAIETKFLVIGVPLLPLGSYYLTNGRQGVEIPLHGKSVLLGYARIGLWIGAFIWGLMAYVTKHYSDGPEVFIGPAVLGIGAAVLTFAVGGVSKAEQPRRLLLRTVAGLGAPPAILSQDIRSNIQDRLEKAWAARSTGKAWRDALESGSLKKDDARWCFALASYAQEPDLAERAWEKFSAGALNEGESEAPLHA